MFHQKINHYNPVIVTTKIARLFAIIYSTISRLRSASLIFETQERDNIVAQAWKLHGILLIEKITGPNFGYDK